MRYPYEFFVGAILSENYCRDQNLVHGSARTRHIDYEHAKEIVGQTFVLIEKALRQRDRQMLAVKRRVELSSIQVIKHQYVRLNKLDLLHNPPECHHRLRRIRRT